MDTFQVIDEQRRYANATVDQILDKYVQAIGGETAFGKSTTCVMKMSLAPPAQIDA
jgi:hypothetical protein